MEGSVLSFLKAEWKVSDTGSAHWASSLLKNKSYNEKYYSITINFLNNILDKCICWYNLYHVSLVVYTKNLPVILIVILQKKVLNSYYYFTELGVQVWETEDRTKHIITFYHSTKSLSEVWMCLSQNILLQTAGNLQEE